MPDIEMIGLDPTAARVKRIFDIFASTVGLLMSWWLIALAIVAATVDTRQFGLFKQKRIGLLGRPFKVLKIRTMRSSAISHTTVTTEDDPRVTRLGRVLRKLKIDELPQLINVLRGQMSFVGPRPDVPGFADRLHGNARIILTIRPGITGPATLKYRNEELLLASVADPERYNREVIFPDKVAINMAYIENYHFRSDLHYIRDTLFGIR